MITANVKIKMDRKQVLEAVKQASVEPIVKCGGIVERKMKQLLNKGGYIGKTSGGKNKYKASDPPKPPALREGNLRGSVSAAKTQRGTVIVGPGRAAWYGMIHDKGGEYGGRHYPARPFAFPSLDQSKDAFPAQFRNLKLAQTPAGRALNSKKGRAGK